MLAVLYWVDLLLMLVLGGWVSLRPNGDRLYGGFSLLLFLAFLMIGLRLFPVDLH